MISLKALLTAGMLLAGVPAMTQPAPTIKPAIDGIFDVFRDHALVGIGEHHRITQELDFYAALVRDPRFAAKVGNVVVEFGGAAHQDIIDRYLNGEDVPYSELRKVWTDTVGWLPVVTAIGYPNFFRAGARGQSWLAARQTHPCLAGRTGDRLGQDQDPRRMAGDR